MVLGFLLTIQSWSAVAKAMDPTPQWLVGTWRVSRDTCEGDNGVTFAQNLTWTAYGAQGTWRLVGNRLETITLRQGSDNDSMVLLRKPIRHLEIIQVDGGNAFTSRWDDGTIRHLERCRT